METKVKLTFLVGDERTSIYVEDSLSNVRFLEMDLTPIELSKYYQGKRALKLML